MKPYEVKFYIYAEDESEIKDLQDLLNSFVRDKYNQGILVTAKKISSAINNFCNNFFVTNFLR